MDFYVLPQLRTVDSSEFGASSGIASVSVCVCVCVCVCVFQSDLVSSYLMCPHTN